MISESPRQFLPNAAKAFLRKSLKQCLGVGILILAMASLAAYICYRPQDTSFNTVSNPTTLNNWLGKGGAILADLLVQLFGYSSLLLFFIISCWGWKLWRLSGFVVQKRRMILSLIAVLMSGVFLNQWVILKISYSSKMFYSGGAVSYLILKSLHSIFYQWIGLAFFKPFLVFLGILSIFLSWYAANLSWAQLAKSLTFILTIFKKLIIFCRTYLFRKVLTSSQQKSRVVAPWARDRSLNDPIFSKTKLTAVQDSPADFVGEEIASESKNAASQKNKNRTLSVEELLEGRNFSEEYQLPTLDLLDQTQNKVVKTISQEVLEAASKQLESVLEEFGIRGEIVNIRPGPVVTMYELKPAAGIKTARVIGLADDIARSMSALSARIAVIPGQNVIGIELPNPHRQTVYLRELLATSEYLQAEKGLPLILGKDIGGQPSIADLTRMPHLLVAGTTGSGKSVAVNTMILSLLYKLPPERCKFIMIDPKMLELSIYDGIPHLLAPVVTDAKKAVVALKWAVKEMENRYRAMSKLSVRNIDGFNTRLAEARTNGELLIRRVQTGFDPDSGKPIFENQALDFQPLPYIVVVVDEMADLMLVAGKEIEAAVQRLAQMARAAGIHLIMATQRPSVDVITGTIKANFPTRISFQVTSKIDSRTILGEQGGEQLLGQGDMLYMAGGGRISRVHGPFVRDDEVERIVKFLKLQGEPSYVESVTEDEDGTFESNDEDNKGEGNDLYRQALDLVLREGKISTSFIQRHLQIGYNRAARIVDQMEKEGIVSAANHVGKREILRG
jgi:S-DNA-T family DNA segregation ATPase FtsK/SpoIIIE